MKQFLGLLIFIIALNSCDDGDLTVENIDFDDVAIEGCTTNNILYKLNNQESLLYITSNEDTLVNDATPIGEPIIIDLSSVNKVYYRFYNGVVGDDNICAPIPPGTPSVTDEWIATNGKVEINTSTIKVVDETTNATKITGYNHNIIFKNITFDKGNGQQQFYETFTFGDYASTITPLPFAFLPALSICPTTNQVYKFDNSNESFTIDIDPSLIENVATTTPRTGIIGSTTNKLVYRLFTSGGLLTTSYFCQTPPPPLPLLDQEWFGKIGGIIEVTTTTNGPNSFKHTIVLKNVTLEKGNNNFQLGNSYSFGDLITTN